MRKQLFKVTLRSSSRRLIGRCPRIVERAIRSPPVIEDAEIELSLVLRLDYKLSLESPVTYRIILNRLPRPTGAQLVHEGIGLSSRRQSGKLERQSAKCKHRHRDTTVVVIGCADSISGAAVREVGEAHRCTLGRNCLSELTAAKFASKTACFRY